MFYIRLQTYVVFSNHHTRGSLFFVEDEKNPPSCLLFLATDRVDLPAHFPILTQFKEDLDTDIPILAKDNRVQYILYPNPGKDSIAVAIFVRFPTGFA